MHAPEDGLALAVQAVISCAVLAAGPWMMTPTSHSSKRRPHFTSWAVDLGTATKLPTRQTMLTAMSQIGASSRGARSTAWHHGDERNHLSKKNSRRHVFAPPQPVCCV